MFVRYLICLVFYSSIAISNTPYIEKSIKKAANKNKVPPSLLRAICSAESNLDPHAYRFGDGGEKNSAIGMCQILYNTARDYGFNDKRCAKSFKGLDKMSKIYKTCKLFGPYTNAYYAAKYLKFQLDRYDNSWISAIAAYNTGSLRICETGKVKSSSTGEILYKCEKGGLLNQKYVDRVLKALEDYAVEEKNDSRSED